MTISIIGAKGEMGRFLANLLSALGPLNLIDNGSSVNEWDKAWRADVIWLSIPRDTIDDLLKDKKLGKEKLIVDICSIKRGLAAIIKKTGVSHLSLHPLQGPYISLNGQRWVVIPTGKKALKHQNSKIILEFLKKKGVNFFQAKSEDYHDFMMGATLSLPELMTIVLENLLKQYQKDTRRKILDRMELNKWAVPAFNAFFGSYHHIINSSAYWLRTELLCKAYPGMIKSAKKVFSRLEKISDNDIKRQFKNQEAYIKKLTPLERERIKFWIEKWFTDSTKMVFSENEEGARKPEITLQYHDKIDNIFPRLQRKIKVGVHGIEGCFTHESVLRFCEELGFDNKNIEFHFLVTAENVLKAVNRGLIDRGIFAMANSGSGAYVSSVEAMGEYSYKMLAVYGMEILQCLITHPAMSLSTIKRVFGHPQAVSQCKRTFAEKYPHLELVSGEDKDDTALCVKRIAEGDLPKTTATLASQIAAKLYEVKILAYNMHHDPFNTTTFVIVKKSKN